MAREFAVLFLLFASTSLLLGQTSPSVKIVDVRWCADMHVIEILLDSWPGVWPGWRAYLDGVEIPMEGGTGKPVIRPNAPLSKPPTGLFVGTLPWPTGLDNVDFPCCGTIQFAIPGKGLTNVYEFNLHDYGCKTASMKKCPSERASLPPSPAGGEFLRLTGGRISKDTIWQGEILIEGSVTVGPGVTLTVKPGTRVKFKHYHGYREPEKRLRLTVLGTIIAEGSAEEPIYFTSDAPDPQNGDWSMIRLENPTGEARFRYCVFEFGQQGLNVWHGKVSIAHCVFRWNNWEGVYFESYCEATIEHCQIMENGYNGLAAEQFNTITIDNCEVYRNGTCGIHIDASTAEIRRSRIHNNLADGLSVDDNGTLRALGVAIYNNRGSGIGFGEGKNIVEVSNLSLWGNGGGINGPYTQIASSFYPPTKVDIGFVPDQSHALGYIPGDRQLDRYMYVYPDDETRRIVRKIGEGLGLTWSVAWDGHYIWTATLGGTVYKLEPLTGKIVQQFKAPGPQPWGMTFDGQNLWIVDFAEKRISKVDPSTGKELATYPTPDPVGGCKGITWDGTYLDIMGWTSPIIYRMDREGHLIETIKLKSGGCGGIAWDGHYFWVPAGGKILKYDTQGNAIGWIYAASEGTWDLAWDGQYLWATQRTNENWQDAKIFQLAILNDHS